jgi:hypothetical protein
MAAGLFIALAAASNEIGKIFAHEAVAVRDEIGP